MPLLLLEFYIFLSPSPSPFALAHKTLTTHRRLHLQCGCRPAPVLASVVQPRRLLACSSQPLLPQRNLGTRTRPPGRAHSAPTAASRQVSAKTLSFAASTTSTAPWRACVHTRLLLRTNNNAMLLKRPAWAVAGVGVATVAAWSLFRCGHSVCTGQHK